MKFFLFLRENIEHVPQLLGYDTIIKRGNAPSCYSFIEVSTVGELYRTLKKIKSTFVFAELKSPAVISVCKKVIRLSGVYLDPLIRWEKKQIKSIKRPIVIKGTDLFNPHKAMAYKRIFFPIDTLEYIFVHDAEDIYELFSVRDLVRFLTFLGLSREKAFNALTTNPYKAFETGNKILEGKMDIWGVEYLAR